MFVAGVLLGEDVCARVSAGAAVRITSDTANREKVSYFFHREPPLSVYALLRILSVCIMISVAVARSLKNIPSLATVRIQVVLELMASSSISI